MSFQAMAWAVKEPLPPYEKLAILVLANYANADGVCWPSIRRICIDTGMSRAQVCKTLLNLEKKNIIVRKQRLDGPRGKRSTVYALSMKAVSFGFDKLEVELDACDFNLDSGDFN
jgi:DNA-binding MarR family transcriptional regulator